MKKIYVCNDTITGIFSAIYDAWKEGREEKECGIAIKGMLEQELFCEYILVEENLHKEQAVERLIRKHLGGQAYAISGMHLLLRIRIRQMQFMGQCWLQEGFVTVKRLWNI